MFDEFRERYEEALEIGECPATLDGVPTGDAHLGNEGRRLVALDAWIAWMQDGQRHAMLMRRGPAVVEFDEVFELYQRQAQSKRDFEAARTAWAATAGVEMPSLGDRPEKLAKQARAKMKAATRPKGQGDLLGAFG